MSTEIIVSIIFSLFIIFGIYKGIKEKWDKATWLIWGVLFTALVGGTMCVFLFGN